MPEFSTLLVFLTAALILLVTPGPAVLYIVARSIDQGRMAGLVSTLGVGCGSFVHVTAAALGLSALLVSSVLAFNVVKYLGAAYLIYLGVRKLMSREQVHDAVVVEQKKLGRIFTQGVWVNVLNPKTTLFFFAFLPQFVDPVRGSVAVQIFILGGLFVGMGIVSDGLYALLAGTAGQWLRSSTAFLRAQRYVTGTIYVGLGIGAALAGSGRE